MFRQIAKSLVVLILGLTPLYAQIQLTLPTSNGRPGDEKTLDVRVSDLTSSHVQGFQFKIMYNPAVIEILAPASNAGTMVENNPPLYGVNADNIVVVAVSSSEYQGSGVLFKVKVKFKQLGSTTLTLDATFNNKFSGDKPFTTVNGQISVSTTNTPPSFDTIPAKTVNENQELKFTVNAIDAESDPITYSAQGLPTGANFNAASKEFSWKPNYTQSGNYTVTFSANDGNSSGTTTVNITVVDVNSAPVISTITDKSVNEGTTINFDVIATDAEGDVLTYSASNLPSGATFDAATHKFSWKPSSTQAGDYTVTFSVSDGKLSALTNAKITVVDANTAPAITPIADKTVNTNQQLTFDIIAVDGEGDPLIYSAANLPTGATFDASLHRFSWKPSGSQAGDYTVTFFVYDGNSTSTLQVKIKVVKVNSAPVFDVKTISDTTISVHNVSMLFKYQFKVTDPDGDVVTFRIDGDYPSGSTLSTSGVFNWITTAANAGRVYMFMVTASDGTLSETKVITITVRSTVVGVEDEFVIPNKYELSQNYPNPFNPSTTIKYSLPKEGNVILKVYNVMGEEVKTLVNGFKSAGVHTVSFDATDLTSGLYLCKIQATEFSKTMKMLLTK